MLNANYDIPVTGKLLHLSRVGDHSHSSTWRENQDRQLRPDVTGTFSNECDFSPLEAIKGQLGRIG